MGITVIKLDFLPSVGEQSGGQAFIENSELMIMGPVAQSKMDVFNQYQSYIHDPSSINLNLISAVPADFIDSGRALTLDVADIAGLTGIDSCLGAAAMFHVLSERWWALTYGGDIQTMSQNAFRGGPHAHATLVESKLFGETNRVGPSQKYPYIFYTSNKISNVHNKFRLNFDSKRTPR